MRDNTPQIGLIGAGFISDYHIAGLQAAGAHVTAIAATSEAQVAEKAERYHIPFATDDYHALLARDDVEAVVVATPDFTHREITSDALRQGKPVLLQKPMARSAAECQAIIDVARETGVALYVSFMHRYFEEVVRVRDLLAEGVLGPLAAVRQRNATPGANWASWFFSRDLVGGGAMLQLGVHGIDLLQHLFGPITGVKAETTLVRQERVLEDGTVVRPDNEDLILALYRFESGLLATHETAYNEVAGTDRFRTEIYGEKGTAWLRTERGDLAVYAPDFTSVPGWLAPDLPSHPSGYRHHRHFLDMLAGDAPDDGSAQAGLSSVRVVEAVYRSASSGQWEEVLTQ